MLATGGLLGLLLMGAAVGGLMAGADADPVSPDDDDADPPENGGEGGTDGLGEDGGTALAQFLDQSAGGGAAPDPDDGAQTAPGAKPPGGALSQLLFGSDLFSPANAPTDPDDASQGLEDAALDDPNDILREAGLTDTEAAEFAAEAEAQAPPSAAFQGLVEIVETAAFADGNDLPLVQDFETGTDRLVLDFHGAEDEAPLISVDTETMPGDAVVRADDLPVTIVKGAAGLTAESIDIVMTGPSLAEGLVDDIADLAEDLSLPDAPDLAEMRAAVETVLDGDTIADAEAGHAALQQLFSGSGPGTDALTDGSGEGHSDGQDADGMGTATGAADGNAVGTVQEFDPAEDRIEITFDPAQSSDPVVGVEDFADGTGAAITLDGAVVLNVMGAQGLDPAEIDLRPVTDTG